MQFYEQFVRKILDSRGQTIHSSAFSIRSPFYPIKSASEGLPRFPSPASILPSALFLLFLSALLQGPGPHWYITQHCHSLWIRIFSPLYGDRLRSYRCFRMELLWKHQGVLTNTDHISWHECNVSMLAGVWGPGLQQREDGKEWTGKTNRGHCLFPYLIL